MIINYPCMIQQRIESNACGYSSIKALFLFVPGIFNEFVLKVVFLSQALACPYVRPGCEYLLLMD